MRVSDLRGCWSVAAQNHSRHGRLTRAIAPVLLLTVLAGVVAASTWRTQPGRLVSSDARGRRAPTATASAGLGNWVSDLSAGAPAGAKTLSALPVLVAHPAPATPGVIAGLAADGIPNVALNAYRVAAARIDAALPGCSIDWSLIAAIGRVESDHGQFGGAVLGTDGTSTPTIIGPALNGQGFAFIRDTDHGVYDLDTVYDRAIGPMQFIPSTWASYAVDGNGDNNASPFDINDTALAAAHYLCVAGGDLSSAAGQQSAVLAYNHSNAYLAEVLALARGYAAGTHLDGPLSGSTSGAVPAPTGDYVAPAAPGPAPAADPTTGHQPARRGPAKSSASPRPGGGAAAPAADGSTPTARPTATPGPGRGAPVLPPRIAPPTLPLPVGSAPPLQIPPPLLPQPSATCGFLLPLCPLAP